MELNALSPELKRLYAAEVDGVSGIWAAGACEMSDYSTALQTVAALGSAIAAAAAFWVAKSTFAFQKNSLLKTANVDQIRKLLQQLYDLKSLASQPVLGAADDDVAGLSGRIAEAKNSVRLLEAMVPTTGSGEMKKIHNIVHGLQESGIFPTGQGGPNAVLSARLDEAIDSLQRIYRAEMK